MNVSQYDIIAEKYDSLFSDPESVNENKELSRMLSSLSGTVFEIGCGTGLLVDLLAISPDRYMGVDPSSRMVSVFLGRHPEFSGRIAIEPFSYSSPIGDYDNVVSIFGSMSYISSDYLDFIFRSDKRLFLMFYKPGYYPLTYIRSGIEFSHYSYSRDDLAMYFSDSSICEFGNYFIVSR